MKSSNCFHCSINTLQLYVIKLSRIELFRIINHRYFYLTKKNGLTVLRKEYKIERTAKNVLSSLLCIGIIFDIIRIRIRFIRYCYWGLHRNLFFALHGIFYWSTIFIFYISIYFHRLPQFWTLDLYSSMDTTLWNCSDIWFFFAVFAWYVWYRSIKPVQYKPGIWNGWKKVDQQRRRKKSMDRSLPYL